MTTTTATSIYHEIRGSGQPVLFIAGATGDAGHFTRTAERLADDFTVITYDRRGNSRSPVQTNPDTAATMAAQADDAAALITACGFDQVMVFGTSGGANITLELLTRHPRLVKAAAIHEPPLLALLPHDDGPNPLEPIMHLAARDPRAAVEPFVRANAGDAAWDAIDPATRDRMLGNGVTLFRYEIPQFLSYRPDEERLRSVEVPVVLLRSREGLDFAPALQPWLERVFGVQTCILSGQHAAYLDTPEVFAEELRPILRKLWM